MPGGFLKGSDRYKHTVTLLADGKVLVVGGQPTSIDIMMASAQIDDFEPAANNDQEKSK
jgi:hypothetical protein